MQGVHPAVADLSHSRLETYEKCPRAFWHAYVNETAPDGYERIESWTGSLVHRVLEEALRATLDKKVPDPVEILQRYDTLWQEGLGPHVTAVRPEKGVALYRENGRRWLKDYLDQAWPFLDATPLHVEEPISFSTALKDGRAVTFRGVLDRVDRLPDGRLRLIDYKTGSWVPDFESARTAYQLALYWQGLLQRYPQAGGVLVWHYLQHRMSKRVDPAPKLLESATQWVVSTASEIQEHLDSDATEKRFPAKPGALCRWCEYGYACDANPFKSAALKPRTKEEERPAGASFQTRL